jgi:hypothetical protein
MTLELTEDEAETLIRSLGQRLAQIQGRLTSPDLDPCVRAYFTDELHRVQALRRCILPLALLDPVPPPSPGAIKTLAIAFLLVTSSVAAILLVASM